MSHAELVRAGFEVAPTFRSPHVTIAFGGDVDERLAALAGCESNCAPTRLMNESPDGERREEEHP